MTTDEIVNALRENAEWCDANKYDVPLCMGDNQRAAADPIESLQAQLAELDKELKRPQKEVAALAIESIEREKTLARLEAEVMVWAKAERDGLCVVLPCKVERIKDAVQKLYESNGCLYSDIGLSHDYGDCSQGCYQCVVDGLRAEAEAALKDAHKPGGEQDG